jgi:VPDSG-CTERM motif
LAVFFTTSAIPYIFFYPSGERSLLVTPACLLLLKSSMKSSLKLLLVLAAVTAFLLVQPAKAERTAQAGPTVVSVPDGGSAISLLSLALLGMAALRRKLSC